MPKHHHCCCALFVCAMSVLIHTVALTQTFTKITTGPWGIDIAASRSVNWVDYDNDGYLDLFVSNGLEGGQ